MDSADNKYREELHLEHLRQAYGFELEKERIVYPVGVEDTDMGGWSTFHHAAGANDTQILVDILGQEGFDHLEFRTEALGGNSYTPLLCAAKGDAIETFNILVSKGADITARDLKGNGVVETAVLSGSVALFQHLLQTKYQFKDIDVWQGLLTMLYLRGEEMEATRTAAVQMTEILLSKDKTYVCTFLERGGLGVARDLLTECANRTKQETSNEASKLKVILKEEEKEKKNVLYIRSLHFLQSILRVISPAQGAEMASHYKEIISLLLRILNKGSKEEGEYYEESQLAGTCLDLIAGSKGWGVACLARNSTLSNLLRSILLDPDSSLQFQIIKTAYRTESETFLENISTSEIEVILTIIETEKRTYITSFFVSLFQTMIKGGRSRQHLYKEGVIEALMGGLGGPDTDNNAMILELLLLISVTEDGLQAIFKSANSFIMLVNRVILETEERFDMCCKLLWRLTQSFSDLQDSVKLTENIGLSTIRQMLDSSDKDIVCIGCEYVKTLLNSDKYDYRPYLVRKDIHLKLIRLFEDSNSGHVLYCVMTSLAELSLAWSSLHPVPAVQNAILQHDCLPKIVQIAHTSKLTSAELQSSAFLLLASTLLGNAVADKRFADHDIDLETELIKQSKHDENSIQEAIRATAIFRYHALLMEDARYKFRCRFETALSVSRFNVILGKLCRGQNIDSSMNDFISNPSHSDFLYIATLCKLKRCTTHLVDGVLDKLITVVYEGSPRAKESAATALACLSYFKYGVEQLLIECHDDTNLIEQVGSLSPNIPISEDLLQRTQGNSVREHRRRVLDKSGGKTVKLPAIRQKSRRGGKSPVRSLQESNKTPVPGDKTFASLDSVRYSDVTKLGLTRPYSKMERLPSILYEKKPKDIGLHSTVDRLYKKLYLRPATTPTIRDPSSSSTAPANNQHLTARNLSLAF